MTLQTILYFTSILLTCALTGFLAWYAWRQPALPGVRTFAALVLSECLLALSETLSMLAPDAAWAGFWFNIRFLFSSAIPVFFFLFSVDYYGNRGMFSKPLLGILAAIPILNQILLWTNNLHGLWVKQEVGFHQAGPFWIADTNQRVPALGFLVYSFYGTLLMLAGVAILIMAVLRKRKEYLSQSLLLTTGSLIALAGGLIPAFNILPQLKFNPFLPAIGFAALLYALAIFRFELLKHTPTQDSVSRLSNLKTSEKGALAFLMIIFILFASGIIASGYLTYQNYEKQYRAQVERQLSAIASLKAVELRDWRSERLADAEVLYQNPVLVDLVQRYFENPADSEAKVQLQAWLKSYQAYSEYDRLRLVDSQGVTRLSDPNDLPPLASAVAQRVPEALQSGQVMMIDFYRSDTDNRVYLGVLIPIVDRSAEDRIIGLVALSINPETYLYPFIQTWPVPSESAETLLIRRDGQDALFLNSLRFQSDTALSLRFSLDETRLPAVKAVLGQTGIVEGLDYRGVPVVADIRAVPNSPWFLVSKMDTAEVYAPLWARLWQTILFFGALILAAGAGLTMIWRQQRMRFYKAQVEFAEALRESEERWRSLVSATPDFIALHDPEGHFLFLNHYAEGFTEKDVIGASLYQYLLPESVEVFRANFDKALQARATVHFEHRALGDRGATRTYEDYLIPITNKDQETNIIAISRDITDRQQAENMIEARLRLVEFAVHHSLDELLTKTLDEVCAITNSPIGFYHFVEPDQKTLSLQAWSTRTEQEYCTAEGKGSHYPVEQAGVWVECIHQRKPVIHNDYASLPRRKGLPPGHAALVRELVVPIFREDWIVAILGVGNKPQDYTEKDVEIVAYFADVAWEIAERKRAEQQLARYTEKLEEMVDERTRELRAAQEQLVRQERLATLGQLAGSISHELRNPLGVIMNAVYFLKMAQPDANDTIKEYLNIIEKEMRTSDKIVTDLLDFTRIKSVEREAVSISEVIRQTLERYPVPPSVEVALELPADLPPVYADPQHIQQVLGNLTVNACQSMNDTGKLILSAGAQGDMIAITVRDNGVGIPPENMSRLFEPLFTTKAKGIGLGLAVSQKLAEANGGRIEVQSEPDKGSTFTLVLPVYSL